jgi:hypothetical protein
VTVRFSTLFLAFAVLLIPVHYGFFPMLAASAGFDAPTLFGVLGLIEAPIALLALLSAASLLVYSAIKKRPFVQFACEIVATVCVGFLLIQPPV